MKKRTMGSRLLYGLLSLVLAVSMLPAFTIPVKAGNETQNYVSMPITIRDYAADGMLFEWNEMGASGDTIGGASAAPALSFTQKAGGGAYSASEKDGYVRYTATSAGIYLTYTVSGTHTRSDLRYCVLTYRTNAESSSAPTIGHRWANGTSSAYKNLPKDGYNKKDFASVVIDLGGGSDKVSHVTIFPRLASEKYIDVKEIAFFSNSTDADTYKNKSGQEVYHNGDTKGFGLLQTSEKDKFNDLSADGIAGTSLVTNGSWNSSSVTPVSAALNSGASETVYGALIRTNLVEAKLGENGKPVYTKEAVDYVANLLKKTLPEVWQNSDGSYNMWYVMGAKLQDLGNEDLASKIRAQIKSDGSYADAKKKYDEGKLTDYTQISTYYDAAYFLLHNIFSDNSGYGVTVPEYSALHLTEKQVNGKTVYVFNSGYDNSVYDAEKGVIYNSQTDKITARQSGGTDQYVRGNVLPEARFDPIGDQGYGKSGNIYQKARDNTQEAYYDQTNYNLSLEGHAKFIYYQDSDLYFNFTGDDDVYLYINGIRVLDMGGGHSISKAGIELNDVAKLCGLKDGQTYDFDFYYMERHGTAANFGIETNIKIVDPSMITTKTGYQNGGEVGYNGYVDPQVPVTYQFTLQNDGDAKIQNLTFRDDDIGVNLTSDGITLNSETKPEDLRAAVYNSDGSLVKSISSATEAELKQYLADGLELGQKIVIYGFKYTIPDEKWKDNAFINYVYTTAVSYGDNNSSHQLNGSADYKVQKNEYTFTNLHYYEWAGKGVTATHEELLAPVKEKVKTITDSAEIQLCTPSGAASGNINEKASLDNGSVTYTGTQPGVDSYYYQVKQDKAVYGPVRVDVYSYDTADNTYVLDYGLPVELNSEETGLTVNDTLSLSGNPYETVSSVTDIRGDKEAFGKFTREEQSVKYTLEKFMSDTDEMTVTVQVLEKGASEVTSTTGVVMTETVTVAPAEVMYYEDTFQDITYVSEDGNQWLLYETEDAGGEQSADQTSNYGSDPNYEEDKQGTLTLDTSNLTEQEEKTLEGSASNGTIHELDVQKTGEVLSFDYAGTGFEIVSRVTSNDYAVLMVKVTNTETEEVVKQFPVITECINGDLYQVPIISVRDLEYGSYKVTLTAAQGTDDTTRLVYIDGVRIYGALPHDKAIEYYNPEEAAAEISEISTKIKDGEIVYVDVEDESFVSGTTMIESREEDDSWVLTEAENPEEYMSFGPNNELYLDGASSNSVIAFYLTPDSSVTEEARTIEIGAHRKDENNKNDTVALVYGSTAEDIANSTNYYEVASAAEQYYTIDASKLVKDDQGRYLVLIGANGDKNSGFNNTLALTNIKIAGYALTPVKDELLDTASAAGGQSRMIEQAKALRRMTLASSEEDTEDSDTGAEKEPEDTENPEGTGEEEQEETAVNENLSVLSASFKAEKVASGKSLTIAVAASGAADQIVILDKDGNTVAFDKVQRKEKEQNANFTAMWTVTGEKGEELSYTVYAVDEKGARSVNDISVAASIK